MKNKIIIAAMCCMFCSCGLKKNVSVPYTFPPSQNKVEVYSQGQQLPENIERVGVVSVGEAGMTPAKKCTYEKCMYEIEYEAKKAGADIIYISALKAPDWTCTCYNITAELYRRK